MVLCSSVDELGIPCLYRTPPPYTIITESRQALRFRPPPSQNRSSVWKTSLVLSFNSLPHSAEFTSLRAVDLVKADRTTPDGPDPRTDGLGSVYYRDEEGNDSIPAHHYVLLKTDSAQSSTAASTFAHRSMRVAWRLATVIANVICFPFAHASSRSRDPLNYITLIENPLIQTPSHRVHATSHFDLHFELHGRQQRIKLSLEPNHDILPEGASITYLNADGEAYKTEDIQRHEHKVFKGEAWIQDNGDNWENVGWARVVIRRDGANPLFEGAFTIHRNHHHIQLRSYYESTRHELDPGTYHSDDEYMVLFRDSDIGHVDHQELKRSEGSGYTCQAGQLSFNSDPAHKIFAPEQAPILQRSKGFWGATPIGSLFGKRQIDTNGIPSGGNSGSVNLKSSIGSTAGCPSTRKVALIGVVTDCSYTGTFESKENASKNVITQINTASNLYERSFSITLGLQNLTVTDAACPGVAPPATQWNIGCAGNTTITDRLNFFSEWRGERNDSNAYWTLLTNCATGAEVGLSWLGQLGVTTVQKSSGEVVSGANVVAKTNTEWQVIAHESGHTFGAVHDCDSQTCADSQTVNAQQCCPLSASTCDAGAKYIMNPSTGEGISDFSPCSIGNICSALGRNSVNASALVDNKGLTTVTGQQCGNGIVEDGEDCDCGGTASCEPALESVIPKRHALALMLLAQLMRLLQMGKAVAARARVCNAPVANAQVEISTKTVRCHVPHLNSGQMSVIVCSKTSLTGRFAVAEESVKMVNAKAHPLPKKSAPGYTITRGSSSEYALAWEVSSFYPCSSAPSAAAVVQNSVREAEDIDSKLRRR
ncbi:MAG: hypothetical protein HETSPECPRED_006501 [Heterodermia speciosa]|uniref:Peptidase M12B domain-containing protein n=1 Tax=Heterodermia speciosa TaxID=116794 RepID=A0A8H3IPX4_9LECA|nr:MAG: hypothetical protein HETSPECPRED_006501 [Heterodermia speciosa]